MSCLCVVHLAERGEQKFIRALSDKFLSVRVQLSLQQQARNSSSRRQKSQPPKEWAISIEEIRLKVYKRFWICTQKKPEDNVAISNPRITPVPKGKNLLRSDLKLDNQTKNRSSHLPKRQYYESESRKNDRNRRKDPILKPKQRENVIWSSELHQISMNY